MMKYNTETLPSGLRVIHLPSASPVIYCGYQVAAGTRHELPGEEGLAHFCEHMTFKGTQRRNAMQIINALEGVGGDLNAFTTKESTVYYAAVSREHVRVAVDLLTDIVFNSQYPQAEIDREVEVICDEIESYNDSPAELIFDEFENMLFQGHPLGHNILGQADQLRTYTTEDALRFARRNYRPSNAIFFAYGDVDFTRLVKLLAHTPYETYEPHKSHETNGPHKTYEPYRTHKPNKPHSPQPIIISKNTHQAHVMIGTHAYAIDHPLRMALYLLNNLLGGPAMNSRLNLALRERNGLVYTVDSTMVNYGDTGLWAVYFGCDPKDISRCRRLVRHELDKLMARPLSATRLLASKQQLKGQLAIACDNREQFALDFGKSFLHHGWERHVDDLYRRIDAVSADELLTVARELFPAERLTTLIFK